MKGGVTEIIEPLVSIIFAIIIATMMGYIAYKVLDLMGKELVKRNPALVALQLAGLTSAVASAPEDAVYCQEITTPVAIALRWAKNSETGMSVVVVGVKESSEVSRIFKENEFTQLHIGPTPQPYLLDAMFNIRKNDKVILAIQKRDEQIKIFEVQDIEECDLLV